MAAPSLLCASRTQIVGRRCRQPLREQTHYRGTDTRDAVPIQCIFLADKTHLKGGAPTLRIRTSTNASNRYLLRDVPASGLEQEMGGRVEALISSRLAGSTMVLMVTDDVAQAKRFARLVLRLDAGKS